MRPPESSMKVVIAVAFVAILAVLGAALVALLRERGSSRRLLTLLRLRVALSMTLIAFIWFGYYMGWIRPRAF
jgi:bacteriorhodopsin